MLGERAPPEEKAALRDDEGLEREIDAPELRPGAERAEPRFEEREPEAPEKLLEGEEDRELPELCPAEDPALRR